MAYEKRRLLLWVTVVGTATLMWRDWCIRPSLIDIVIVLLRITRPQNIYITSMIMASTLAGGLQKQC